MLKNYVFLGLASALAFGSIPAEAGNIGRIQAFYNSSADLGTGVGTVDGTVFVIENTGTVAITNGVFKIGPGGGVNDSFKVGTIAPGGRAVIIPGVSHDGATGHTFFALTGSILDESDSGPDGNDTQFQFTGKQNGLTVYSPVFTPAATVGNANDGSAVVNFLGGPSNADAPCWDCFGPKVVATLSANNIYSIDTTSITPAKVKQGDYINVSAAISGNPANIGEVVFMLGSTQLTTLTDPDGDGTWTGQYQVTEAPGYQLSTKIYVKNTSNQIIAKWPGFTVTP